MTTSYWTSYDLQLMPNDGKRYEIINGELYVSKPCHWNHQLVCAELCYALDRWNERTGLGQAVIAPGLVFSPHDDVAPDVVWISNSRLAVALEDDGYLHIAPELVIEVLSPGSANERRDREAKLKLYSRRGVHEYWIADWRARQVEVYRREQQVLRLAATVYEGDTLQSPLLPGFTCSISMLFEDIPKQS